MESKSSDERAAIYRDLHTRQLEPDEVHNRHSARMILGLLFKVFMPKSVLDVGCGLGTWLSVARELGVHDVRGVDGVWLDKSRLRVPEHLVRVLDLEKPFDLGRRFDLVVCLEVAEHLDGRVARDFVASLSAHADVLLFSAAIPLQGGHHHVNEQWPDYWRSLFDERGFAPIDIIRPQIWDDSSILWWLKQNTLLYVSRQLVENDASFRDLSRKPFALSVVHPEVYMSRLQPAYAVVEEHKKILSVLSAGGTFSVRKEPNGNITISRVEDPSRPT